MLDRVAKMKRILFGSRIHDEEVRRKLFLRMVNLLSLALPMLPVVTVIWWWFCSLLVWSVTPSAAMVAESIKLDPRSEALGEDVARTIPGWLSFLSAALALEMTLSSPTRWDPFRERLLCNAFQIFPKVAYVFGYLFYHKGNSKNLLLDSPNFNDSSYQNVGTLAVHVLMLLCNNVHAGRQCTSSSNINEGARS